MLSSHDASPPPADERIAYGLLTEQFAELRVPRTAPPHPIVVVVHGGFWRAEHDLVHLGHACAALTSTGVATCNVEYRRVGQPEVAWPHPLHDVIEAVRFLARAPRAELDASRLVLVGFSAGGQLAVLAASALEVPLRGVVSLAGVLDLRRASELALGHGAVDALLGGTPAAVPGRYAHASPIEQPSIAARQIILHGDLDVAVPCAMSRAYADAALARGDDVDLRVLPGAGHMDLIDPASDAWAHVVAAVGDLIA